jgi:hypothetical protein
MQKVEGSSPFSRLKGPANGTFRRPSWKSGASIGRCGWLFVAVVLLDADDATRSEAVVGDAPRSRAKVAARRPDVRKASSR